MCKTAENHSGLTPREPEDWSLWKEQQIWASDLAPPGPVPMSGLRADGCRVGFMI